MRSVVRLWAVLRKEALEIARDPITVGIAVALPLVMMYLFSYAITLDVKRIPLVVVDRDDTAQSRELVARFARSDYFAVRSPARAASAAERALDAGRARIALFVPEGFARDLRRGLAVGVQAVLDGSFPNTAVIALGYAEAITRDYELDRQRRALGARLGIRPPASTAIEVRSRVRYNQALRAENFIVPGLFALILLAFPPLLTALAVVREVERGSIQQIYASPIRTWELFLGKLAPYAAIAFGEMLLLLAAATWWFEVPVRGSVVLLLGFTALYVMASCGIGLVVSTWTRSQVVALLLTIVLTFMPAFLFSGFLFAIDSMPAVFRGYTYLFPARYFTEISRGIALKGAGLATLWSQGAILAGYTLVLFVLVAARFRKEVA